MARPSERPFRRRRAAGAWQGRAGPHPAEPLVFHTTGAADARSDVGHRTICRQRGIFGGRRAVGTEIPPAASRHARRPLGNGGTPNAALVALWRLLPVLRPPPSGIVRFPPTGWCKTHSSRRPTRSPSMPHRHMFGRGSRRWAPAVEAGTAGTLSTMVALQARPASCPSSRRSALAMSCQPRLVRPMRSLSPGWTRLRISY